MKKKIVVLIAVAAMLGMALSVSAASINNSATVHKSYFYSELWEVPGKGANW